MLGAVNKGTEQSPFSRRSYTVGIVAGKQEGNERLGYPQGAKAERPER